MAWQMRAMAVSRLAEKAGSLAAVWRRWEWSGVGASAPPRGAGGGEGVKLSPPPHPSPPGGGGPPVCGGLFAIRERSQREKGMGFLGLAGW